MNYNYVQTNVFAILFYKTYWYKYACIISRYIILNTFDRFSIPDALIKTRVKVLNCY